MSSSTLTPQSVADKLSQLYALPDFELKLQAAAITFDFRWWLQNNFQLTASEVAYLRGITPEANFYFGSQCALCFVNRLDIAFVYPAPPVTPGFGKWTELLSHLRFATNGKGSQTVTGSIEFVISYTES